MKKEGFIREGKKQKEQIKKFKKNKCFRFKRAACH